MYKPNENENDITDDISKAIEEKLKDIKKAPGNIDDITKAVNTRAVGNVSKTDYAADISRAVERNVTAKISSESGGTEFLPDISKPENEPLHTTHGDSRHNPANRNAPAKKSTGLWGKFKKLRTSAKVAVITGGLAAVFLLIFGIWALYGTPNVVEAERDEPVLTTPPPTPPRAYTVSIIYEGDAVTSMDILVESTATLFALIDTEEFDEEIIWTNTRNDIVEITSIRGNGAEISIEGLSPGTSRLTATVGGIESVVIIRVGEAPPILAETMQITLGGNVVSEFELYVGDNITLSAVVEPEDFEETIRVSSSNPDVLIVAQDFYLETEITATGVSAGTAILTVDIGRLTSNIIVEVSVRLIEVPHPFADSLGEFFADANHGSHASLISNMPGSTGDVVLASKLLNPSDWDGDWGEEHTAFRFMYMHNGVLVTHDFVSRFFLGGGATLSANNYLASISLDDTSRTTQLHLFSAGQLQLNEITLRELSTENRFLYNERELSRSEYDTYLNHYGLDRHVNRVDDTAQILAMTVIVEAT